MVSLFVLILAMTCPGFIYWREDVVRKRFKARHNILTGVTCERFVSEILRPSYSVTYDSLKNSGSCDHIRKEIVLTHRPNDDTLFALFQAGHEAGHAFFGPGFFRRNTRPTMLLFALSFAAPAFSAALGFQLTPVLLVLSWLFLAVWCYQMYRSEAKASLYAGEKLRLVLKQDDIPIAENAVQMDVFCRKLEYGGWFIAFSAGVLFLSRLVASFV